jgi:hypothetical protein
MSVLTPARYSALAYKDLQALLLAVNLDTTRSTEMCTYVVITSTSSKTREMRHEDSMLIVLLSVST